MRSGYPMKTGLHHRIGETGVATDKDKKDIEDIEDEEDWEFGLNPWDFGMDYWDVGWDTWVSDEVFPNPDWYPSNSLFADIAWMTFARRDNGTNAMAAIEEITKERLPLPDELIPWVEKACVAWRESSGNKRVVRTERTDKKWSNALSAIYLLRMKGNTKVESTTKIADKTNLSYDTLFATHKFKDFHILKDRIHHRLMLTALRMMRKGDYDLAESFIEVYKGFFKKGLYRKEFSHYSASFNEIQRLLDKIEKREKAKNKPKKPKKK